MKKFEHLRTMLAVRVIKSLDARNVILGEIAKEFMVKNYIPKIKREIKKSKSASDRKRLRELLKLWQAEAKKPNKWSKISASIIQAIASTFKMEEDEAEEAAQEIAVNIYGKDASTMKSLKDFDPEDGIGSFEGLWRTIIKTRTKNYFRDLITKHRGLDRKIQPDDVSTDPLDMISGGNITKNDQQVKELVRQMGAYVYNNATYRHYNKVVKLKDDPVLVTTLSEWLKAFTNAGDLTEVSLKRSVAPKVKAKHGIAYDNLRINKWPIILNSLAEFLAGEFNKSEAFFKKMLFSSNGDLTERVASEFYMREMKRWLIKPSQRVERLLRKAYM